MRNKDLLSEILGQRLRAVAPQYANHRDMASEIIVFGSMPAGLDGPDSDIDVLCIGGAKRRLKTALIDMTVLPVEATQSKAWLQSELASHIREYGIWIQGSGCWRSDIRLGRRSVDHKCARIAAFMSCLPRSWLRLDEAFRVKYSTKLRRETQRLLLLEQDVPVPPTRVLDHFWSSVSRSPSDVRDRLASFVTDRRSAFLKDLFGRIDAQLSS